MMLYNLHVGLIHIALKIRILLVSINLVCHITFNFCMFGICGMKYIYFTIFIIFFSTGAAHAQLDLSVTGFLRNYNAIENKNDQELIIGRNRLRLDLTRNISNGRLVISNDIQNLYSAASDSIFYRPREAYIDLYLPKVDIRIGRQMISWGRADGTFIADILTPVDLREFLTQDFTDIKTGVTAFNGTRYFGSNFLQLVINPVFNSNNIPESSSRWFPSSLFPANLPIEYVQDDKTPTLGDTQIAARFAFRSNLKWNLDVAAYYWHFPNPAYNKGLGGPNIITNPVNIQAPVNFEFREQFLQSWIGAYSGFYKLTDRLILKSESAFYQQRLFDIVPSEIRQLNLSNPTLPNLIQAAQVFITAPNGLLVEKPWLISMAGLQYQWSGWLFSSQYINERIFNYSAEILQKRNYDYMTLLIQKSFFRDKVNVTSFGRYNFDGQDFWVNPEIVYDVLEGVNLGAGTQIFGGKTPPDFFGHLSFNFFEDNSFTYLKIEAFF